VQLVADRGERSAADGDGAVGDPPPQRQGGGRKIVSEHFFTMNIRQKIKIVVE
jgi:hypothetical protein